MKIPAVPDLRKWADSLPTEELLKILSEEVSATPASGLPFEVEAVRHASMESPSYFITEVVDPFYKKHFERDHYVTCDEVIAPWVLGESIKHEGLTVNPKDYTGLLILKSRGVFKSTLVKWMSLWVSLYWKLRLGVDARQMLVHQVLTRALEHSESLRQTARSNQRFRANFPEFVPPDTQRDWDEIKRWRWPGFATHQANEYSYSFYGSDSSKTGGHYSHRWVDDWETEESVTNPEQIEKSERSFKAMESLDDLAKTWCPWIVAGTIYHYHGPHARLKRNGGWYLMEMPAFSGSPKAIFDLVALDWRTEEGTKKIERGIKRLERERPKDLNFPTLLSWRKLYMKARSMKAEGENLGGGHYEFSCQLLLAPVPEGEQRFDRADMDRAWTDFIPGPDEAHMVIRCDPAISTKKASDDTAINACLVDWRGHRWYVDGFCGKEKKPTEQVRKMYRIAKAWAAKGYVVKNIGVESVAYQEALAQICRAGVPARDPAFDGETLPMMMSPCPVVSIDRSSDMRKDERILQMTGPVERGEVHIWKQNPVGKKLYDEHDQFPYGTKNLLDTCHDCWVKAPVPSKKLLPDGRRMDPQVKKLLGRVMMGESGNSGVSGLSNVVPMEAWGKR